MQQPSQRGQGARWILGVSQRPLPDPGVDPVLIYGESAC